MVSLRTNSEEVRSSNRLDASPCLRYVARPTFRPLCPGIRCGKALHIRGHLVTVDPGAGQRAPGDNLDEREVDNGLLGIRAELERLGRRSEG